MTIIGTLPALRVQSPNPFDVMMPPRIIVNLIRKLLFFLIMYCTVYTVVSGMMTKQITIALYTINFP